MRFGEPIPLARKLELRPFSSKRSSPHKPLIDLISLARKTNAL
jgi:hypothetical protein